VVVASTDVVVDPDVTSEVVLGAVVVDVQAERTRANKTAADPIRFLCE
jgi:hypothetical protein